jgi:hypothetical protein
MASTKGHYYYYQLREDSKDAWQVEFVESRDDLKARAEHVSVFGVNAPIGELQDQDIVYTGDWILDIDCDNNLPQAIEWAQELIRFWRARNVNPEGLTWFATGGRGFHIVIPLELTGFKPSNMLPLQLKDLTKLVSEYTGVVFDLGLYNRGRGHPLRVENKRRANGHYKVPVTPAEIEEMTPESYLQLTSNQRLMPAPVALSGAYFARWAKRALDERADRLKNAADKEVTVTKLKELEPGFVPECVKALASGKKELYHGSKPHNYREMALVGFLQHADLQEDERKKLVSSFVANNTSQTYHTEESRRAHLHGVMQAKLDFSCQVMLGTLQSSVCEGCPVKVAIDKQKALVSTGIIPLEDGYYEADEDGNAGKRLTTFVFAVRKVTASDMDDGFDQIYADVMCDGDHKGRVVLCRDAFLTDQHFRRAISGVEVGNSYGTTEQTTKLRQHIMESQVLTRPRIEVVRTIGLHFLGADVHPESGEEIENWVYAEPNWSIHSTGIANSHRLVTAGILNYAPHDGRAYSRDSIDPAVQDALMLLLGSNEPHVVGKVLGWVMATHVKPHLAKHRENKFPLLNLYGLSGSGKTQTTVLYTALASADYRNGVMSTEASTAAPLKLMATQSNTVPRIFDEANKAKMSAAQYEKVRAVIKAIFGGEALHIGTIARGPRSQAQQHGVSSISLLATSPSIYMGTQPVEEAELQQRNLEVALTHEAHRYEGRREKFRELAEKPYVTFPLFFEMARTLIFRAMQTKRDTVWDWFVANREELPVFEASDRPRDSMAVGLTGLDFFINSLIVLNARPELIHLAEAIKFQLVAWYQEQKGEINKTLSRNELDNIIETLNWMAELEGVPGSHSSPYRLTAGVHYMLDGNVLYLNSLPIFAAYISYCQHLRKAPEYQDPRAFERMLTGQTQYFLGRQQLPGAQNPVPWLTLDVAALQRRGLQLHGFRRKS